SRTQQEEVAKRIIPHFLGAARGARKSPSPQEAAEMWRTVASLERIVPDSKASLGEALLARLEHDKIGLPGWFAIGRLGARVPLFGPASDVVPARIAEQWVARLLALDWKHAEQAAFAVAEIA